MSVNVTKEVETKIKSVTLTLSADAAKELYGLTATASVNYVTDTFDEIAYQLDHEFNFDLVPFVQDENGEFGPYKVPEEFGGDCGCGVSSDDAELEDVEDDEALGL